MITTNDKKLYNRIIELRTHGISKNNLSHDYGWNYDMNYLGYNYRLTDIQCALGISQLKRADEGLNRRRKIAKRYDEAFCNNSKIKCIIPDYHINHAYHLYVIQVDNRQELYDQLKLKNIFTQVHYIPVHKLTYYKNNYKEVFDFPVADNYYKKCLSLPIFPGLNDEQQEYVIDNILKFV